MAELPKTRAIRLHARDNVAVLLDEGAAGAIELLGEPPPSARIIETIARGHKAALQPIAMGEPVVKYGVVIGLATADIAAGTWVHMHNCRSQFDQRSQTLDRHTGAPTDIQYE